MIAHRDPVIQQVLDIWTPRFLASGISYGDLEATVAAMDGWDAWGPAWAATAATHEQLGETARAEGRRLSAVSHYLTASRGYHLACFISVSDGDRHRMWLEKMVECHDRVLAEQEPPVEKLRIPFEDGHLLGLLSRPRAKATPPVVVVLPGLDSTKETRHAGRGPLLRRGLAVLSIEGPGQGEMSLTTHIRHDYEVAVSAVIDHLESRRDLDAGRVAVSGSSLGGYYACRAAAFDRRVIAAVANCGPYEWGECFDDLPVVTREAFRHYSGAASAVEAKERANRLSLRGVADRIECPLVVVHGKLDPLIPWEHGQRIVDEARGPATFILVDDGIHGVANVPYRFAPYVHDWLARLLGGTVE
ncbi:MAG: alpha/beta hydrolase family protein [Acidimicrobiales bacterium]